MKYYKFATNAVNRPSYKKKYQIYRLYFYLMTTLFLLLFLWLLVYGYMEKNKPPLITPIASKVFAYKVTEEVHQEDMDYWVGKYVDQYFELNQQRSEARMIVHCLLHRESGHQEYGPNDPHGDNGKAGGILQFHQPTWEGYRKLMMDEGLVDEIGSRYNPEQAIHTLVWALKNNRGKAWGPIYRALSGSDRSTCQVPSWSKR